MPTESTIDTIPEFHVALRELIESGLEVRPWDNARALLQGFETDERRILVRLSTIRAHYRLAHFEPYEAGIKRYMEDIARIFKTAVITPFEVGNKVVSTSHGRGTPHHGIVEAVTEHSVTIRHNDGCCENGLSSVVSADIVAHHWKVVFTRPTAWERLLDDDPV